MGTTTLRAPKALDIRRLLGPLGIGGSYADKTELRLVSAGAFLASSGTITAGGENNAGEVNNIRALVAKVPIGAGEIVGEVPWGCVLTGETAHTLLQQTLGVAGHQRVLNDGARRAPSKRRDSLYRDDDDDDLNAANVSDRSGEELSTVPQMSVATHVSFSSRDGVAMTAALGILKFLGPNHPHLRSPFPKGWAAPLPPIAPSTGAQLYRQKSRSAVEAQWAKERTPRRNVILLEGGGVPHHQLSDASSEEEQLLLGGEDEEPDMSGMVTSLEDGPAAVIVAGESTAASQLALVETEITSASAQSFLQGDAIALTERKQRHFAAHHTDENAAMQQLAAMTSSLERELLIPIAEAVMKSLPPSVLHGEQTRREVDADTLGEDLTEAMRWAHSILRSRCVNAHWHNMDLKHHNPDLPLVQPALIPLVDLLNHSSALALSAMKEVAQRRQDADTGSGADIGGSPLLEEGSKKAGAQHPTGPNMTYRVDSGQVIVVATQPIPAGAPLCIDYSHYRQRLVLFERDPHEAAKEILNFHVKGVRQRDQRSYKAMIEMNTLQDLQLMDTYGTDGRGRASVVSGVRGIVNDDRLNTNKHKQMQSTPMAKLEEASIRAQHGTQISDPAELRAKRGEGLTDAEWCFNFGFIKSAEEKEAISRGVWKTKLPAQVARMTDPFRRGQKGEYVVGVPQGMAALRAQRATLERHQYNGKPIFPSNNRL